MINEYLRIITNWANDPYITHDDVTKCGQCWREQIKSEICKELILTGKELGIKDLEEVLDETRRRWRKTDLYGRVTKMMDEGKNLEDIGTELELEGIEI